LRSIANDGIELLQFFARRELQKERLDKLVGVIDPLRFEVDRLAFARGF
jgi:hypothetical protein